MALSERHLDSLLDDTSSALDVLVTLSESFKKVETQTTAFQAQCEDLLAEQKRLGELVLEVGTDLQYYAYLEPLTRRLNAPGASKLIRSDDFLDILTNLNICVEFMDLHVRLPPSWIISQLLCVFHTFMATIALDLCRVAVSRHVAPGALTKFCPREHISNHLYSLITVTVAFTKQDIFLSLSELSTS